MKHPNSFISPLYPRPQLVNPRWSLFDGEWDFAFDDENIGENEHWFEKFPKSQTIIVPFSYQTKASGIHDLEDHPYVWYRKVVALKKESLSDRIILHFEGSDYFTKVWVNKVYIGSHKGGYTRFNFDITEALKEDGTAEIVVRVEDKKEATQPRGKQTWLDQPFECYYHPTTGIWKSVWCELVHEVHLTTLKITPRYQTFDVEFELGLNVFAPNYSLRIEVTSENKVVNDLTINLVRRISNVKLDIHGDHAGFRICSWTVNNPHLYDVKLSLLKDGQVVETLMSYFGFRIFHTVQNNILLNMNPIYLKMVLHQGYYRDSGLSIPSHEAMLKDLLLAKKLGFNGIRMHEKIEDERFYYYADVLGLIIWCEMPSTYEFKDETIDNYVDEWKAVVKQLYNHPSICAWVPINESWGLPRIFFDARQQHTAETLYHLTKAYDDTRPVISNDGWEQTESDIVTLHNYTQKAEVLTRFYGDLNAMLNGEHHPCDTSTHLPFAKGYQYKGQPVIMSEFAGIGFKTGKETGWGYGDMVKNPEDYVARLASLIKAVRNIDGICGYCITQLTDVEQEINGLLDIDRVPKAPLEELARVIKES